LIATGNIKACHDLSDGGLAIGLADMAMASGIGLAVSLPQGISIAAALFSEDQARYLLAVDPSKADDVFDQLDAAGVTSAPIGQAGGCELAIQDVLAIDIDDLKTSYEAWMPAWISNP
jgi:phosphoribosylformylglycinamidine synthase subunit PurL